MSLDPYIETKMDWLSIIVICAIVGAIFLFFVFPLMMFACFKSRQRRVEKVERREMLAQSLRASRESLASTRGRALRASRESLDSLGGGGLDAPSSKRRRPPLDESSTFSDSADKSKFIGGGYFGPPQQLSPQTSFDYASTRWDGDSSSYWDDDDVAGAAAMPLCENEIATVPMATESRYRPPGPAAAAPYPPYHERPGATAAAGAYYDDDASVTQSLMGSNFRRHQRRPRPAPSYDQPPSAGGLGSVDEAESVVPFGDEERGGGRPTSDSSSVVTGDGRSRPPRPRLR